MSLFKDENKKLATWSKNRKSDEKSEEWWW